MTVTGLPWPSVIVTVCAATFVLVTITAMTQEVVDVSEVVLVGRACQAGVKAAVPHAVLGIVCTCPMTFAPVGS